MCYCSSFLCKFALIGALIASVSVALGQEFPIRPPSEQPLPPVRDPWSPSSPSLAAIDAVFFPPVPPVYGTPTVEDPRGGPFATRYMGRPLAPPEGLADFVNEIFYPPLSTRLFERSISQSMTELLERYGAERQRQVNALLNQMVGLQNASREARTHGLREFGRQQTPLLLALESEAEALREKLVGGWHRADWNENRGWHLGDAALRRSRLEAVAEFQVLRAAAYYERGFGVEQRGLLRELALEAQARAAKERGGRARDVHRDAIFFSPESARLRLPPNSAPALREKIARFNGQKATLKRELQAAVIEQDRANASKRAKAFAALADRQWPHLASLEDLAEDIRSDLAAAFEPSPPPAPPWLPANLRTEIDACRRDSEALAAESQTVLAGVAVQVPRPPFTVSPHRQTRMLAYRKGVDAALATAEREFHLQNEPRFSALRQRRAAIREMLTHLAETKIEPQSGKTLDAPGLMAQHVATEEKFETFGRESTIYPNYRIAIIEPGLSAAQRRLLFGHALVGLAQSLPEGEKMPTPAARLPDLTGVGRE